MKQHIQNILGCAAKVYEFVLIPPSLNQTRKTRKTLSMHTKPALSIRKKKPRRLRTRKQIEKSKNGNWAVANNNKGVFYATKIQTVEGMETPGHLTNVDRQEDQSRISELEKELADLKKSLASLHQPPTMPPPPPLPPQKTSLIMTKTQETMTPSIHSPPTIESVPAPNFDSFPTPENKMEPNRCPTPKIEKVMPPTPPTPPTLPTLPNHSQSYNDAKLCRTVPSGLQRTQSITDLIASGKVSKEALRKVPLSRSPGGTPVRNANPGENFLAQALRNKFKHACSPISDKENSPQHQNYQPKTRFEELLQTPKKYLSNDSVVSDSEWESPVNSPVKRF